MRWRSTPPCCAWTIEIEGAGIRVRLCLPDVTLTDLAEFTRRVVGATS